YNDGSRAFIVMQGRSIVFSHPIRNAMSSGIMNESVISELDDYTDFIRSLRFDEFVEAWVNVSSGDDIFDMRDGE
ncbi:MAG: hypothetical protein FWC75_08075, partial [Oscillospiraceae bacterium]|nr:hypothetical protein [Oscillospiraceae bacterium]